MKFRSLMFMIGTGLLFWQMNGVSQILDPVSMISINENRQQNPQAVYNVNADEYLVVWEDYRKGDYDIYGQFINGDGTLKGENFIICNAEGNQYLPHLDFNPFDNQYVVVFRDERNHIGESPTYFEIYGCVLSSAGEKVAVGNSEGDKCYRISFNTGGSANWPSISFNYIDKRYLVVFSLKMTSDMPPDVYGQLLAEDGNLMARSSLAKIAAGIDNFPIGELPDFWEDVTDITYQPAVNEWFVVYSKFFSDYYADWVVGQRVNSKGVLLKRDGSEGYGPIDCSGITDNGTSCSWPTVQANAEYPNIPNLLKTHASMPVCEVLVGFRIYLDITAEDLYGQRVAFYTDEEAVNNGWKTGPAIAGRYYAAYYSQDAVADDTTRSPFAITNAVMDQNHFDIAFSSIDNEFLVSWGDGRNFESWIDMDLFCQLLKINTNDALELVDLTHATPVLSNNNIPVSVDTSAFDGSGMYTGLAHSYQQNDFLITYVHASNPEDGSTNDIYGRRIAGLAEGLPVSVDSPVSIAPDAFILYSNYPNPFNPTTKIKFGLSKRSHVSIRIYNIQGREINHLIESDFSGGSHEVTWNGLNSIGHHVGSGMYIYRVEVEGTMRQGKMMLLR